MRGSLLFLLATTLAGSPALAQSGPGAFSKPPVSEEALSEMRGGFALPGGLDVAVAVQTDTLVNGTLLLRSVYVVDKGPATITVFGRTGDAPATAPTVETSSRGVTTSFTVTGKAADLGGAPEGLTELGLVQGGPSAAAGGGSVRLEKAGSGSQVILDRATLEVRHLAGQAYGSAIANRGNDITIDTVTNINIDVKNATPLNIGSSMLRVDALVTDVASRLGR